MAATYFTIEIWLVVAAVSDHDPFCSLLVERLES
jgi:hypothetical protein